MSRCCEYEQCHAQSRNHSRSLLAFINRALCLSFCISFPKLSSEVVGGMQPHSSFHRHTFSIPNPSRRFTSSSPRQPTRPTPFSKILLSALAVTASKTIILDGQTGYGGGAGWLTLAFWVGRIVSEARNELLSRGEGKGKERERPNREMSTVSRQSSFRSPALIRPGSCYSCVGIGSAVSAVRAGSQCCWTR